MKDTQMSITQGPRCFFNYIKKREKQPLSHITKIRGEALYKSSSRRFQSIEKGKTIIMGLFGTCV